MSILGLAEFNAIVSMPLDELVASLGEVVERGKRVSGVDYTPAARELLRALAPAFLSASPNETPEEELDRLHGELRSATAARDVSLRRELFARIAVLEEAEADRMSRYFEEHAPFKPDQARATRERARALLKHAAPSSRHRSR